jgi:hypothetical protein
MMYVCLLGTKGDEGAAWVEEGGGWCAYVCDVAIHVYPALRDLLFCL